MDLCLAASQLPLAREPRLVLVQILHGSIINNYKNGQAKSGQRKRKNKKGAVRMVKKMMTNVFAVFVIFIVLAIIIPLPTPILDFLLIINIGLSLVILLMTMYIKKALEFSIFPTILLLTTVFRLSLNVSTTRGILSNGCSAEFCRELVAKGASRLILGHLSQENNSPKMAYEAVEKTLKTAGMSCGVDFTLDVAPVVTQGKYIII